MMKYDEYKSSGIDWLGNIPNDWEVKRVKDLAKTKSGTTPHSQTKKYYSEGTHNWVRTTDLNDGELFEVEYKITDIALEECNMSFLPIDTILVAMYGGFGTIGKNSILKKVSTINQSVCAILPSNKLHSEYFLYFLKFFRSSWKIFADGTRKDPNINQDAVKNLFIYFPKIEEQKEIVIFLNSKTQAIDKKINLLTQKANYYKEYRKSLINETVCKGSDKNVKLKDSGVNWIGQIPEHWAIVRLKSLGNIETSSVNKKIEENEGLIKLVNYTDVYGNSNKEIWNDDNYMVVSANVKQLQSKLLKKGDVLFTPSSETIEDIGVSAVVMENLKNTLYSYHLLRLRFSKNVFLNFKKYLFNNDFVQNYFGKSATGTTRKILGLSTLNNLLVILPPTLKEQEEIATYLDEKTQTIDKIVTNINTQIVTLKELRKTLINDAVTGKIKVINNN